VKKQIFAFAIIGFSSIVLFAGAFNFLPLNQQIIELVATALLVVEVLLIRSANRLSTGSYHINHRFNTRRNPIEPITLYKLRFHKEKS